MTIRYYLAYSLSLRNLEEMMVERQIYTDYSISHFWALIMISLLNKVALRQKKYRINKKVMKNFSFSYFRLISIV
ncbi:hypothetical protein B9T31_16630 [Acinetobacter sp. ANC 4558]|nr:hypothetical protein B9T31_16630 [Acinetobacter sp. ANC 4558]